jgi:uncharacterized membrane protein
MIKDFFYRYFIEPPIVGSGYNIVNTVAYAVVFLIFVLFTGHLLKRAKIKINREFVLASMPFVILGSLVRVMEDSGVLRTYLLVTPIIWVIFFCFFMLMLAGSYYLQKRRGIPYYKTMFVLGVILAGLASGTIRYTNISAALYVIAWLLPFLVVLSFVSWPLENKLVTSAQVFDSVSTFVSLRYFGYSEQHVLPNVIINLTGTPFSFVLVKFAVVVFALIVIDRNSDDEDLKNLLKLSIAILGLAPGVRDLVRLMALV